METYDVVHVLLRHLRYLMKPILLNRGLHYIRHQHGNVRKKSSCLHAIAQESYALSLLCECYACNKSTTEMERMKQCFIQPQEGGG